LTSSGESSHRRELVTTTTACTGRERKPSQRRRLSPGAPDAKTAQHLSELHTPNLM
jgi:hypothetical protein